MIVIIGLVVLLAAVIAGVAGVLANSGSSHALTHGFAVFGYHVTGSTGTLFLYGIVVGAIGLFGMTLLLAGARRTSRRGHVARRGLKQSRRETAAVSQVRDDLLDEREASRVAAAGGPANGAAHGSHQLEPGTSLRSRLHQFGVRLGAGPGAAASHSAPSHPAPAAAAGDPASYAAPGDPGPDAASPAAASPSAPPAAGTPSAGTQPDQPRPHRPRTAPSGDRRWPGRSRAGAGLARSAMCAPERPAAGVTDCASRRGKAA